MRKYITEFIGTFFLVFTIGCAVLGGAALAPLAIGAVLMVMVFAGGHISGGHFNPAVSLAVLLRRGMTSADLVPYWVAQIVGGLVGAVLALYVVNPGDMEAVSFSGREIGTALVAEFLFTFALAFVVLNVATSKAHPNNHFYGLAIGFTVLAGAVAVGGLTGGAFNPAVAVGIIVMGLFSWSTIWVFLLAQVLAAAAAAYTFRYVSVEDAPESEHAARAA